MAPWRRAGRVGVEGLGAGGYETSSLFSGEDSVASAQFPGLEFPLSALWEDLGE